MVVARLYGGLGNQMFQYAAALAAAERLDSRLLVDATWFRSVGTKVDRAYGLDAFGIEPTSPLALRLNRLLRRPRVVRENDSDSPIGLHGAVELDGYWQSERCFAGAEQRVRETFRFVAAEPALAEELRRTESVSVHVRRGDYVAPKRAARFGVLDPVYYEQALALVRERVREPRVVVFSDDPEWCRDRFDGEVVATGDPATDVRLMAACRHHVVANSSFSWWGAWLGETDGAVVVAPAQWYRDPTLGRGDTVPERWLRVDPYWS